MVATIDAIFLRPLPRQTIEKTYDELNRMTRMVMLRADGSTEDDQTFTYDAMGQKTAAWDYDSSLAWVYDGANRVAEAAVLDGPTNIQPATLLTHAYNAVGERVSLSDSEGGVSWYDHDGDGNLTRVTTAAGDTIDLAYDPAGRLTRIANPNAVETQVLYDSLTGRPSRIDTTQGGAPLLPLAYVRLRPGRQDYLHRRQWRHAELHLRRDAAGHRRRLCQHAGELRLRPGGQPHVEPPFRQLQTRHGQPPARGRGCLLRLRRQRQPRHENGPRRGRRLHRRRDDLRVPGSATVLPVKLISRPRATPHCPVPSR
jgi:YD repeat-containing protein